MNVRNRFDKTEGHAHPKAPANEVSKVQSHFAKDLDINEIARRNLRTTGSLSNPNPVRQPIFGDFSSIDFLEMQNALVDVNSKFMQLPARLRGRFNNDPYQMLRWAENPDNAEEARKYGFIAGPASSKDQIDLVDEIEAERIAREAATTAPKADPEAQPGFKKGGSNDTSGKAV